MQFDRIDCFDKISVRIPHDWVESSEEEEGSYAFYDPEGNSGVLRVSLFTNKRSQAPTLSMLQEEDFDHRDEEGVKFFVVDDERTVAQWEKTADLEDDTYLYYWTVAAIVGERTTRRALFSYAVSLGFKSQPSFPDHLEMVRDCVFATHFIAESIH